MNNELGNVKFLPCSAMAIEVTVQVKYKKNVHIWVTS